MAHYYRGSFIRTSRAVKFFDHCIFQIELQTRFLLHVFWTYILIRYFNRQRVNGDDGSQCSMPTPPSSVPSEVLGDDGRRCSMPTPPSSVPREVLGDDGRQCSMPTAPSSVHREVLGDDGRQCSMPTPLLQSTGKC